MNERSSEFYKDESGMFKRPDKLKSDKGVIYTLVKSEPCGIYADENGVEIETFITHDMYFDEYETWTKTIYGDDGRKLVRSFRLKPFKKQTTIYDCDDYSPGDLINVVIIENKDKDE